MQEVEIAENGQETKGGKKQPCTPLKNEMKLHPT
jgi:hypothetical protein